MRHTHGRDMKHACFRYLYYNRHRITTHTELAGYLWGAAADDFDLRKLVQNTSTIVGRVNDDINYESDAWTVLSIRDEGYQMVSGDYLSQPPVTPPAYRHGMMEDYPVDEPDLSPHVAHLNPRHGVHTTTQGSDADTGPTS